MILGRAKYKRVLLKISGEVLGGPKKSGLDTTVLAHIAKEIKKAHKHGVQIAIVVGGGNIFRGLSGEQGGIDRATGDYMGMMATGINALAMQDALEKAGMPSRVMAAFEMKTIAELFIRRRAIRHLEKGRVIILAGGTGNPYFTTDTTAALRAAEIDAEIVLKATKVDGVYDSDPAKNRSAKKFNHLNHMTVLKRQLKVMDSTAISLCMDNNTPLLIFNLMSPGNIERAVLGKKVGTIVETKK